jgi:hypothetical protein
MASDLKHLWNRGRNKHQSNWYLRLPIPRRLRKQWPLSKSSNEQSLIIQPLDTGDLRVAQRKRDELTVAYRREVFDRLEAGEHLSPDQLKVTTTRFDVAAGAADATAEILAALFKKSVLSPEQIAALGAKYMDMMSGKNPFENTLKVEPAPPMMTAAPAPVSTETLSEALAAWLADPRAGGGKPQRPMTAEGHRVRASRFIKAVGDIPLANVTRAMASDFLATLSDNATRTRNNYAITLWSVFKNARLRGRFKDENPFEGLRWQLTDEERESKYVPFELAELSVLLADAKPEVKPATYNVQNCAAMGRCDRPLCWNADRGICGNECKRRLPRGCGRIRQGKGLGF